MASGTKANQTTWRGSPFEKHPNIASQPTPREFAGDPFFPTCNTWGIHRANMVNVIWRYVKIEDQTMCGYDLKKHNPVCGVIKCTATKICCASPLFCAGNVESLPCPQMNNRYTRYEDRTCWFKPGPMNSGVSRRIWNPPKQRRFGLFETNRCVSGPYPARCPASRKNNKGRQAAPFVPRV